MFGKLRQMPSRFLLNYFFHNKAKPTQQRQTEYLAALHQITLDLLGNHDRQDLLQSITTYASQILNAPYVEIMFKQGEDLVVTACNKHQHILLKDRAKRGEAVLAWQAYDTHEVITTDDYSSLPFRRSLYDDLSLKAVACFPIVANGTCFGVMDLSRVEPHQEFTPEQIQQGELFAQLAAMLLHNANLRETAETEITQRRQSDQKYRLIQERQQALLSAMPDLMFRLDKDGTYLDFHTPDLARLLVKPEAFLGRKISDILPPDLSKLHMSYIKQVLETGKDAVYEYRLRDTYFECRMVVANRDEVLTINRDISERKLMELHDSSFLQDMKALQEIFLELSKVNELETLYYNMIKLTKERLKIDRVGLFIIDPLKHELVGTFGVDTNGAIRDESYYREVITDNHWTLEVLNDPKLTRFWPDIIIHDNGLPVGNGWKTITALWDGNTSIGYLLTDNYLTQQPARSYQDELTSLLGSAFGHLIRLKQIQISLQENEQQQRALLQAIPDLMFRLNREGRFLDYHPANPDLFIEGPTAFLGKTITEVLPSQLARIQMQHIDRVLQTGEEIIYEETISILGKPTNLESRMVVSGKDEVLAIVRDISERKKLEKQSLALAVEKARGKLLSKFVQSASHEFRTPLSIINTAIFLMSKTTEETKRQNYADRASAHVSQLAHLLDMILTMTKLDSETSLKKQMINTSDWMHTLVDSMQDQLRQKNLCVQLEIEPLLPKIYGDYGWLQEAAKQILDNAIRFTPDNGSITISIYLQNEYFAVEISDSGIGINELSIPLIFERFWREDEAHTTPGFGLGLSIAQKIVEMHEGYIDVKSVVDKGSSFKIMLPFASID